MENLCYAVGDEGSMPYTYVNCTQPMKGQYVKFIRQTGDDVYQHNWMNFCEVEVYGYLYYGELPFCAWYTVGTTRVDGDPVFYPLRLFQYRLLSESVSQQSYAVSMTQQRVYGEMKPILKMLYFLMG